MRIRPRSEKGLKVKEGRVVRRLQTAGDGGREVGREREVGFMVALRFHLVFGGLE